MKVVNTANALNDNFYHEAVGTLTDANTDPNALPGVSLGVDDLGYIKQGSPASSTGGFEPTQAQLDAMNSGITSEGVEQITTNKNNILYLENENSLRNIYPITLAKLKELNKSGTWTDGNGISTYVDGTIKYVYNIINSTITVTGYGTKNLFLSDYITIDNGLYFCTGCPSEGSADTYYLAVNSTGWTAYNDFGDGREINVQNNQIKLAITIKLAENDAADGLVFQPMIITNATRQAGFTTYKPYAPTNRELFLMLNQ